MKPVKFLAAGAFIALLSTTVAFVKAQTHDDSKESTRATAAGDGFALLELFTSEGCSSCPPADEILGKMQKDAGGKPVYVLAYHVDYWDRLGWKDIYSSAENTERQTDYSDALGSQVYTPQVVVNGKEEFVGADKASADSALTSALKGKAATSLALTAKQQPTGIQLSYKITGAIPKGNLFAAVVQKHAISKVKRGENEGRTLHHYQIVRKLYKFDLKADNKGTYQINLPNGFNTKDWEIIGFIQNRNNGPIKAAARANFGQA